MSTNELTLFDIKFNEGMERLNNLIKEDTSFSINIKNFLERYKLEKLRENKMLDNYTSNSRNLLNNKRNQIVDIYEIRDHDKKVQQFRNKNYLKNEIEWYKIKKREDEQKNKYRQDRPGEHRQDRHG